MGVPFESRGQRLDEWIEICRQVWTGRITRISGEHFTIDQRLVTQPRPARPIPIVVGGMSEAALRRVATLADGWVPLVRGSSRVGRDVVGPGEPRSAGVTWWWLASRGVRGPRCARAAVCAGRRSVVARHGAPLGSGVRRFAVVGGGRGGVGKAWPVMRNGCGIAALGHCRARRPCRGVRPDAHPATVIVGFRATAKVRLARLRPVTSASAERRASVPLRARRDPPVR